MNIQHITENGVEIAVVSSDTCAIVDGQSAMDLAMSARYETDASSLVIPKALFAEDFFILSSGLAGEILQKWITYQFRAAIWGDYSKYTSKPLKDFIYESNHGRNFFFVSTEEEAIGRLAGTI